MKNFKILFFFICSFFLFGNSFGQKFVFEKWDNGNTLEGFGIYNTSMVDRDNALWVGGRSAAIAKFSNDNWEVFDLDLIFEGQLSSSTNIRDLHQDTLGNIWAISDKGIFVKQGEEWTYYKDELEKSFGYTIAEKGDTMFFSTRGGVMTLANGTWGYEDVIGNQPGYVTIDGDGFVWMSFSNGDGNFRKVDGNWESFSTSNSDICTGYALDNETSPNGEMWIYGASGAMCKYDGESFTDYKLEGGTIGILNTISFSPSGDHVFLGGLDFISNNNVKHFFKGELVDSYQVVNDPGSDEIFSMSMDSESNIYLFFEDVIFKGSLTSSASEIALEKVDIVSNLVQDVLVFRDRDQVEGTIFSSNGQLVRYVKSGMGVVSVSDLKPGIYFLIIKVESNFVPIKFMKL